MAALQGDARAKAAFDSLDRSSQYRLYLPVLQARSPKARAARIEKLLASLQAGAPDRVAAAARRILDAHADALRRLGE